MGAEILVRYPSTPALDVQNCSPNLEAGALGVLPYDQEEDWAWGFTIWAVRRPGKKHRVLKWESLGASNLGHTSTWLKPHAGIPVLTPSAL